MSSYLCFLCHNDVNFATNEELREKYKDIVGVHLCPESHLCYICSQLLNKLATFKSICLKQSLEYPSLFSEKSAINYEKTETELVTVCPENDCQHYTSRNTINYHFNYIENNNFNGSDNYNNDTNNYTDGSNEYAELEDEEINENNEIDYTDFNFHNDCDKTDNLFDNVSYNFNDETHNQSDDYNFDLNNYTTNEINEDATQTCHFNNDYNKSENENDTNYLSDNDNRNENINDNEESNEINDFESDHYYENEETNERNYIDEEIRNETTEMTSKEIVEPNNETKDTKKRKKEKKSKKRSYEKIVLSYKEQKSVLERQRKAKKYIEAEFKCHSCALAFLFKDTYQSHMMRHEESNGQFSCNVCGLRFATQNARCMHVILHSEIYKCNKCGAEIKRPHRSRHSRECWRGAGADASCHLCGKAFKDNNCLQQHLKRFHAAKVSGRTYSCNVCGKTYKEQSAVRTHMVKHINRRFDCPHCKSSFASPYTLSQHLKSHTKEPYISIQNEEYSCVTCNTSYKTKKSLLAHFRNTLAHQQTSFECPICSRNCPNPRALQSHIESHTLSTHRCSQCSSTHSSRKALLRHARSHANVAPRAQCHLCGARFKGQNKLTRHLKEVCERARMEEAMATFYEQADLQV